MGRVGRTELQRAHDPAPAGGGSVEAKGRFNEHAYAGGPKIGGPAGTEGVHKMLEIRLGGSVGRIGRSVRLWTVRRYTT